MKIHELKILAEYAAAVALGKKRFELRKDDRGYEVGDLIHFNVISGKSDPDWEACNLTLMDSNNLYRITYILRDVPQYGLAEGYCIFGIERLVPER